MVVGAPGSPISFGPFEFDPASGLLYRGEEEILLPPRAAAVFEALLRRPGEVLSRDDLLGEVWRDTFVGENSLTKAISVIRHAIGDDARHPTYVKTVPKRGYRFIGNATAVRSPDDASGAVRDAAIGGSHESGDARVAGEPAIGSRLGSVEILDQIGSGAMARVFRGWDTVLEREVAIKVPAETLLADPDRRARTERESKLLAALSHPNVAAIYSLEEIDGSRFPVLEMVAGETLKDRLASGRLALEEALEIAAQIASGLEAAHQRGIVHRDVKPANIKLTPGGQVKVMDFGLARALEVNVFEAEASASPTESMTIRGSHRGSIVGTAAYMSPEQARGMECDTRADIWSFGCVLYEMLAGRRPFAGATITGTITELLEHEPAWSELPSDTPIEIRSLLARCLEKDPARRLRDIGDARTEIAQFLAGMRGIAGPAPFAEGRDRPRASTRLVGIGIAVTIAAVTLVAIALAWRGGLLSSDPSAATTMPITSTRGTERDPALSPDGSMLAFTWAAEPGGTPDLYVKAVDGGDPVLVSAGAHAAYAPAWAPAGDRIAFIRHVEDEDGEVIDAVFFVSPLGTDEREHCRIASGQNHDLSWSPTGDRLAISALDSPPVTSSIYLLAIEGCEMVKLTEPPSGFEGDSQPRFSPDGELVAFRRLKVVSQEDIWIVPVQGGEARPLTAGNPNIRGFDWTVDGRSLVFSTFRSGNPDHFSLWTLPVDGGEPQRLPFGEQGQFPSLARTVDRLAYMRAHEDWEIWRVPGPQSTTDNEPAELLISSTWAEFAPRYSPDAQSIVFVSARSGDFEIWLREGSEERRLTRTDDVTTGTLSWSPDGSEVAFISKDAELGTYDVWIVNISSGRSRRLTSGPDNEMAPSWSKDGDWVYFFSEHGDRREIYRIPAAGGTPIQITHNGGTIAQESPRGDFLYFAKGHYGNGPDGIWRMPIAGGDEQLVIEDVAPYSWDVFDGGIVYFNRRAQPRATFELFRFEDGSVTRIATPESMATDEGVSVSPDGQWILFVVHEIESDIMLVESFR